MDDYERKVYNRYFLGEIPVPMENLHYSFGGRFLIGFKNLTIVIVDLFHLKQTSLFLDISAATNDGSPLKTNKKHKIQSVLPLDLSTILIAFRFCDSSTLYLGIGEMNLEDSAIIVQKTASISVDSEFPSYRWFPQSHPPNLSENLILRIDDREPSYKYFTIKVQDEGQLHVCPLDVPVGMNVFGCFDGCLYALAYSDLNDNDVSQSIDLVKISLSNGQHVWEPTNNYEIIERGHFYSADFYALYWKNVVCWQPSPVKRKDDIILLDLETLEWKYTNIEFDYISSIGADSSQTLMVSTRCNDPSKHNIYRFVVNQPDKLSNLVWLRLKRVFNARPAAYKFILSQLPTNFKQKCPFSRSRNHNLTKEIVNTEKQIEEHYRVVGENDDQFRAEKKVEIEELRSCN